MDLDLRVCFLSLAFLNHFLHHWHVEMFLCRHQADVLLTTWQKWSRDDDWGERVGLQRWSPETWRVKRIQQPGLNISKMKNSPWTSSGAELSTLHCSKHVEPVESLNPSPGHPALCPDQRGSAATTLPEGLS